MKKHRCAVCGKTPLSKNEVGLTRKLVDWDAQCFYCLDCLAEYLEADAEFLLERVKQFKEQGCRLF